MQQKALNLQQLAELTGCQLIGKPETLIYNVADLENATAQDASFLANPRYRQAMQKSQAGVIFIDHQTPPEEGKNYLVGPQPSHAFQKVIDIFHPVRASPSGFTGIHPTAIIHPTAKIENQVTIGPHAVIDEHVTIGEGSFIGAGTYIGPYSEVGEDCLIHPRVTIREKCQLGNRVIIQPGAVIGSCGFGYATDKQGHHSKLNQVGNVILHDDVEIGANTTIDRARFKSTVVGQGSKLDNLIQLGHGVEIGTHNMIVAQTGIAGSTKTGTRVILAGQVAVAGHLQIDDDVMVAGKSGVSKSLSKGKYGGIPAVTIAEYNRNSVFLRNIESLVDRVKRLEARLQDD